MEVKVADCGELPLAATNKEGQAANPKADGKGEL